MSEYIMEIPEYPAKVVQDGWNTRIEWEFKQREKIVRCRDCKRFVHGSIEYCTDDWCKEFSCQIEPNGFCAWGERRES